MNPLDLPFDTETMLRGLRPWVECESPTWDAAAVGRMLDLAARDMAILGASIDRIAGRQGFAGCVRARFPHPGSASPAFSSRDISTRSTRSGRYGRCRGAATALAATGRVFST